MKAVFFALGCAFASVAVAATATDDPALVPLAKTPPAIQKAIQDQVDTGTLGTIERVDEKGVVSYEVEMTTKDGQERDFTLGADGKLENLEIGLADAPAPIQQAIKAQVGGGKIESIEKAFAEDDISYEVEMTTKAGDSRDFSVDANGKLVSLEVALTETPSVVQKTITSQIGQGKLTNIDKMMADGVSYEAELTYSDGQTRDFTVSDGGKLESMEVFLPEMPAPVQKTITAQASNGTVENIEKNFDEDGITYDVQTFNRQGKGRNFVVGADGAMVSVELALAEVPPVAQDTIKQQLGNGKILQIDKVFGANNGAPDFQVMAVKNGAPFNFSVGQKGKFLGRDD